MLANILGESPFSASLQQWRLRPASDFGLLLMVVRLVTRSATKRRAGIDVISSSDPWRAKMIITLFMDNWVAQAGDGNDHGMYASVFKDIRRLLIGSSQYLL